MASSDGAAKLNRDDSLALAAATSTSLARTLSEQLTLSEQSPVAASETDPSSSRGVARDQAAAHPSRPVGRRDGRVAEQEQAPTAVAAAHSDAAPPIERQESTAASRVLHGDLLRRLVALLPPADLALVCLRMNRAFCDIARVRIRELWRWPKLSLHDLWPEAPSSCTLVPYSNPPATYSLPQLKELMLAASLEFGFGNSPLGDEGIQPLARAIACGALWKLESLHLMNNDLGVAGVMALAGAIATGFLPRLSKLQLGNLWNKATMGDDGVQAFAPAVASGSLGSLTELRLDGNRIGDAGVTALVGAVASGAPGPESKGPLPKLERLHLGCNQIGTAGVAALADTIADGALPALEFCGVHGNPGSDERCPGIDKGLEKALESVKALRARRVAESWNLAIAESRNLSASSFATTAHPAASLAASTVSPTPTSPPQLRAPTAALAAAPGPSVAPAQRSVRRYKRPGKK